MTEHTHSGDGPRGPFKALSRMARLGDVPVVIMLAWAGWLAVPWSFSGLAQARAAAAAAAAEAEPPPIISTGRAAAGTSTDAVRVGALATATPARAWGIPAAHSLTPPHRTIRALRDGAPCDRASGDRASGDGALPGDVPCDRASGDRASGDGASGDGLRQDVHLAAERARIAGEVHDAAGHGLAAIALQAGLALVTLDDDPEQARASLLAIKETSTTALTQLRAALDRLDPRDSTHDPREGANDARDGAHDLPSLIDGVRAAGLAVDVQPADPVVPAHLSGTVYGVVRESLTNVLRHAAPTRALVRLSDDPAGLLVLEIADRGPDQDAARLGATENRSRAGTAEGRGLAGMRARVLAAGGHFTAGPREGGGFQVLATFPQQPALQNGSAHHKRQPALRNGSADHNTADSPADVT